MFRSSKILVQQNDQQANHTSDFHNGVKKDSHVALNVKVSRFLLFFTRVRTGPGRQYRYAGDDEMMAPLSKVVEIPERSLSNKPQPPPMPYRLTFKGRKASKNPWSGHKTVAYQLGFNSSNIYVKVEVFHSGLRRAWVNGEEIVREKVQDDNKEWSFSYFFSDQEKFNPAHKRLGTILKIVVSKDLEVALFADGFPAECLRRSSIVEKGSPPPPNPGQDVETLDPAELTELTTV